MHYGDVTHGAHVDDDGTYDSESDDDMMSSTGQLFTLDDDMYKIK